MTSPTPTTLLDPPHDAARASAAPPCHLAGSQMCEGMAPCDLDRPLLDAFAEALRTLETADLAEDDDARTEACDVHNEWRSFVYFTPPRTIAGALVKLLMLAEPCLGLNAGARGDGGDEECIRQVATFLASLPGTLKSLPVATITGAEGERDAVADLVALVRASSGREGASAPMEEVPT